MKALARTVLCAVVALPPPLAALGQGAAIGVRQEPGGVVVGRICVDLDRDGACGEQEPGIAGARLGFEDGRRALADEQGRFHVTGLIGRVQRPDRSAYGAHVIAAEGLGVRRSFELPPRGAAHVELAVPPPAGAEDSGNVLARGSAPPRLDGEVIRWPLAGTAPAGSRVRSGGAEVRASGDGRWALELALGTGRAPAGVEIRTPAGGLALWEVELVVARPSAGPPRVYPSRPRLLAAMSTRPAGGGLVLVGRLAPGVSLTAGGMKVGAVEGAFGAWIGAKEAVEVIASLGGVSVAGTAEVDAAGDHLEWSLLGEAELQVGGAAGAVVSGRVAGTVLGRLRGFELRAGLDLDDRDRDASSLASPRDALAAGLVLDPLQDFVEAGDGGGVQDANPGRGRLWARVDGRGQRLEVGDTRSRLGAESLGGHDRTFHGARWEGSGSVGSLGVAGILLGGRVADDVNGLPPGVPAQDVLVATGGSLLYLSHGAIVVGSEVARIEWRDPTTGLVVERRELVRGRDYELDAAGGRLLLARPLPTSRAAIAVAGGDPFSAAEGRVIVDYLRAEGGDGSARGLAGGEVRGAAGPLSLTVGGATESRPGPDWQALRAAAALDLGRLLRARFEVAHSEGQLFGGAGTQATSLDGGFRYATSPSEEGASALAFAVGAEGEAGRARWRGWWRERPAGFSDALHSEPVLARERGVVGEAIAGPVSLKLAWVDRRGVESWSGDAPRVRESDRAYGAVSWKVGPVGLTAEGLHEELRLPLPGAQTAAGLRAEWPMRGVTLEVGHLQSIAASGGAVPSTFTAAGATLESREGSVALRAGWGPDLGPRVLLSGERGDGRAGIYGTLSAQPASVGLPEGGGSAIGGRQGFDGGALFTEERVTQVGGGVVAGRVVGATLAPSPGLSVTLSGERGVKLGADGSTVERGAGGLSAAWGRGPIRLDGRAELRWEGGGEQWLASAGGEWGASRNLTVAARALLSDGEISGRRSRSADAWLSAAWRRGPLSVLWRLGQLSDEREGAVARDATTAGVAVALKAARRATLGLAIDGVRQRLGGTSDDRLAGSARLAWGLLGPLDVAVEYARRGSLDGKEIGDLHALRGEAGLNTGGVRLALGYTVAGFRGTGLDPLEEDGRFYLRAVLAR